MPNENRKQLSAYRMEKARQCLITAKNTMADGDYATSANRSYYAIFHGMRAVLALEHLDFKKHSAVMGKFRELYIKTGVFDSDYSKIIGDAFDIRGKSDYDDFYLLDKFEVEQQIFSAESFLGAVTAYLSSEAAE